jgi:phage regulator Rha-like protein
MMALTKISQAVLTMTSREIAELTGKEHRHVLRDIEVMFAELGVDQKGYAQNWTHPQNGQTYPEFVLDRELTETLLTGYSATLRRKVIARWHELENAQPKFDPATLTRIDILKLAMDSEEGRIKAEAERDRAIATKAQIGSRREATAMATASASKRESERLRERLGFNTKHATIKAVEGATKRSFGQQGWRPLKSWCSAHGISVISVPDPLYGEVKSWPANAWGEIYGIDLAELFSSQLELA